MLTLLIQYDLKLNVNGYTKHIIVSKYYNNTKTYTKTYS